jgi:hypothetical protein
MNAIFTLLKSNFGEITAGNNAPKQTVSLTVSLQPTVL